MFRNSYSGVQQGGKLTFPSAENNDNDLALLIRLLASWKCFLLIWATSCWSFCEEQHFREIYELMINAVLLRENNYSRDIFQFNGLMNVCA